MNIQEHIEQFNSKDIYTLLLFALFKLRDDPLYATLSELIYILDKKSFLKLCEYFGGLTITIPTIDDLKELLSALLIYCWLHISKPQEVKSLTTGLSRLGYKTELKSKGNDDDEPEFARAETVRVIKYYKLLKEILAEYNVD